MTGAEPSQAHSCVPLGHALATGRVSAAPDDQYESARGALQVADGLGDPEWSPRSAYVLGELSLVRGHLDVAERNAQLVIDSQHPDGHPPGTSCSGCCRPPAATGPARSGFPPPPPPPPPPTATTFGNPEQSALAQQNLLALDQIGRDRQSGATHAMTDDGVDVSSAVGHRNQVPLVHPQGPKRSGA